MHSAIYIPNFALQALTRHCVEEREGAVAVLDDSAVREEARHRGKAPVLEVSAAAARRHIAPGMTATQAQARDQHVKLLPRSPRQEATAREVLLQAAAEFSPLLEDTAPGLALLRLTGNRSQLPRTAVEDVGLEARLSLAATPALATLAARSPALAGLEEGGSQLPFVHLPADDPEAVPRFLAPLPISALEPSAEARHVLGLWGIKTVGQLLKLPRQELGPRLGREVVDFWEQFFGDQSRPLNVVRPPVNYAEEYEFDYEVQSLEPLLFLLRRFLGALLDRVRAGRLVVRRMEVKLAFDGGRRYQREFRVAEPCTDEELLFRMLHTHLEDFQAPAPLTWMRLGCEPMEPRGSQLSLFEDNIADRNQFAETLSRIVGILDEDHAGAPTVLDTHRPDAFAMNDFLESINQAEPSPAADSQPAHARPNLATPPPPGDGPSASEPVAETPDIPGLLDDGLVNAEADLMKVAPNKPLLPTPLPRMEARLGLPLRRFRPPRELEVERDPDLEDPANQGGLRAIHTRDGWGARVLEERGPWIASGDWWERQRGWAQREWDIQAEDGTLYRLAQHPDGSWRLEGVYG
jgi:protein ImuB